MVADPAPNQQGLTALSAGLLAGAGDPGPPDVQDRAAAQIELGKLLAMAQAGRQPDSDVTAAQLLDQYVSTAGWDVSTRESNLGYIRRTIKPALLLTATAQPAS